MNRDVQLDVDAVNIGTGRRIRFPVRQGAPMMFGGPCKCRECLHRRGVRERITWGHNLIRLDNQVLLAGLPRRRK